MDTQVEFVYADEKEFNAEMSYKLWEARLKVNPLKSSFRSEPDLQHIIDMLSKDDNRSKIKEIAK